MKKRREIKLGLQTQHFLSLLQGSTGNYRHSSNLTPWELPISSGKQAPTLSPSFLKQCAWISPILGATGLWDASLCCLLHNLCSVKVERDPHAQCPSGKGNSWGGQWWEDIAAAVETWGKTKRRFRRKTERARAPGKCATVTRHRVSPLLPTSAKGQS